MLLLSVFFFRRFPALRQAAGLLTASVVLMIAAEFSVLATPAVRADTAAAEPIILLEGRYSDESLLVPRPVITIDISGFSEP
jgi:hypothetical protein